MEDRADVSENTLASFFDHVLQAIDGIVEQHVQGNYEKLANVLGAPFATAIVLYLIIRGYRLLLGYGGSVHEVAIEALRISFIFAFAFLWAGVFDNIYSAVYHGPEKIATAMVAADGEEGAGKFGDILKKGQELSSHYFKRGGLTALSFTFMGVMVLVTTVIMAVAALAQLVLAKLGLAILLGLAPFFVALLVFQQTGELFKGWLRQVIGLALIPLFIYAGIALIFQIFDSFFDILDDPKTTDIEDGTIFLIVGFLSVILFVRLGQIASSVAGSLMDFSTRGNLRRSAERSALTAVRILKFISKYLSRSYWQKRETERIEAAKRYQEAREWRRTGGR